MSGITEARELNSIRIISDRNSVEVEWADVVRRGDGSVIASTPFNRAYSKYDREQYLQDMADHPSAVTYADLAGLEVRPAVPEPTPEPQS